MSLLKAMQHRHEQLQVMQTMPCDHCKSGKMVAQHVQWTMPLTHSRLQHNPAQFQQQIAAPVSRPLLSVEQVTIACQSFARAELESNSLNHDSIPHFRVHHICDQNRRLPLLLVQISAACAKHRTSPFCQLHHQRCPDRSPFFNPHDYHPS